MTTPIINESRRLFTPGPLGTSETVKRAMLCDYGSREPLFIDLIRSIRNDLLTIGGVSQDCGFEAIPVQGSGTFGIESVIGSIVPSDGKLLVIVNGAYGQRMVQIARCLNVPVCVLEFEETEVPDCGEIEAVLEKNPAITHVAAVHCETTTGILNPIDEIGGLVSKRGLTFIVDAMSSFGGIPIHLLEAGIDFLISSSNKCLEGVPGFAFVLARRQLLEFARGRARSVSLDLTAQWDALEASGQFRFTPPTHAMLAFKQALTELSGEGGVSARYERYSRNCETLIRGMEEMGFTCLIGSEHRGPIITAFSEPDDDRFEFDVLYEMLAQRGCIIYPGKVSLTASFRIGTIGRIFEQDVEFLLTAIRESLRSMGVNLKRRILATAE